MIETVIRLEQEQHRFLQIYKITYGLSVAEVIRTLVDEMMEEESELCKQFADVIFRG